MALTGEAKAATSAADVAALAAAAAGTANGKSQNEQFSQAVAITQSSVLGLASDQQQADMAVAEAAAVSRQLSQVFAEEVSEPESVPEEMDSASESIEVVFFVLKALTNCDYAMQKYACCGCESVHQS